MQQELSTIYSYAGYHFRTDTHWLFCESGTDLQAFKAGSAAVRAELAKEKDWVNKHLSLTTKRLGRLPFFFVLSRNSSTIFPPRSLSSSHPLSLSFSFSVPHTFHSIPLVPTQIRPFLLKSWKNVPEKRLKEGGGGGVEARVRDWTEGQWRRR